MLHFSIEFSYEWNIIGRLCLSLYFGFILNLDFGAILIIYTFIGLQDQSICTLLFDVVDL